MDIFTTQLTRVAPNRIHPDKLKVKSLAKEAKLAPLDEEHDHLDGHEETTVTHQHAEQQFHHEQEEQSNQEVVKDDEQSEAEHKTSGKIEKNPDDGKIKHLDIFV